MLCPFCNADDDKVIDSRSTDSGHCIRRRRHCNKCGRRYTTYERAEERVKLSVIKRDGTRVPYDRTKLLDAVRRAAYKRKITPQRLEQVVDEVEEYLVANFDREVPSQAIGEHVCQVLRRVDKVAYVRFASVYRDFQDVGDFIDEVQNVIQHSADDIPGQQDLFRAPGEQT